MKAAIFDLDGTLLHSAPDIAAAANGMLVEMGRAPLDDLRVQSFVGNGVPTLVARCLADDYAATPQPEHTPHAERFTEIYVADPLGRSEVYPGVETMLEALAADGWALGVCTNKSDRLTQPIIDGLGWRRFFGTAVIAGDALPVRKPDPEHLAHTARVLGVDLANVVYLGDSETDAKTAAAANVPFLLFTQGYLRSPIEDLTMFARFDHYDDALELIHQAAAQP